MLSTRLPRSPSPLPLLAALPLALGVAAPLASQPSSGLYRVRDAAPVSVCGGFAGRCEAWRLHGTVEILVALPSSGDAGIVEIAGADLSVTTPGGGTFPFPAPQDLPLAGLAGELAGGTAELRAENDAGQRAELELQVLDRGPGDAPAASVVLTGRYDEGCCDRFVFALGNLVLDRVPDAETLLLDGPESDRFEVRVLFSIGDASAAPAIPARRGPRSGAFWFFSPENPELFVKVVVACEPPFERIWFFATGLTDLAVTVLVEDRLSGLERVYGSPAGRPFQPILDTGAFPCPAP